MWLVWFLGVYLSDQSQASRQSNRCITIHIVKNHQSDSEPFSGVRRRILSLRRENRAQAVSAVRVMGRYGKCQVWKQKYFSWCLLTESWPLPITAPYIRISSEPWFLKLIPRKSASLPMSSGFCLVLNNTKSSPSFCRMLWSRSSHVWCHHLLIGIWSLHIQHLHLTIWRQSSLLRVCSLSYWSRTQ